MKLKRITATLLSLAMVSGSLPFSVFADDQSDDDFSGYVLMNIPYGEFYTAENAVIGDIDAISSATNKVGNYGKAGGAYHSGISASISDDGTVTAVGGENGAKLRGVTWAVKVDNLDTVKALGGNEITDSSAVTVATLGKGQTSSSNLTGYEALMEAPDYSYYVLDSEPENYLEYDGTGFKSSKSTATSTATINVSASYGTNWGDVQLNVSEASEASDKLINAVVITADDGTTKGLYQLAQIWSSSDIAWKVAVTDGLDGKTIKNIRYYCTVKDNDLTDNAAPVYTNYIYDYNVELPISQVYTGTVTAKFENSNTISLSGLPADAENVTAKVYYTTGGRNPVYTYLTPMEVDPADDDIDPVFVNVENGKISIIPGSVTNKAGTIETFGTPVDGTTYTVELSCNNYIINKFTVDYSKNFSGYVLMNIPYGEFYTAENAVIGDIDAISSATNKVGNYGKAGGAYHSGISASISDDGTVTAVGGENGAKLRGVTWAVKVDNLDTVKALGGNEITDSSAVTVATLGKGQTSSSNLTGYEALMEAPDYSYYVLDSEPENYLEYDGTGFKSSKSTATSTATINVSASYGTNWGDVQLNVSEASEASDKLINAVVITADDGTTKGLYQLAQIWSSSDIAWKVAVTDGLDGKTIKNIRYYCTVKDNDLTDNAAPVYTNYIYDYNVELPISQVYTGTVTAKFENSNTISLSGLPADAENVTAKVYYTTGGRNPVYTYLTPMEVDPADDDIDPVFVNVENGKISIIPGSVTNKAGTIETFGTPVDGTTYTVELSCNNYIINKFTVDYIAEKPKYDGISSAKAEKAADDTIRFVASIDSLDYKVVGFIFEADGIEIRRSTNVVYTSVAGSELGLEDFAENKYLYSFEISDIADPDTKIKVTPYSVDLNGNEVKADSIDYSLSSLGETVSVKTYAADDDTVSGSAVSLVSEERTAEDSKSETKSKEIPFKEEAVPDVIKIEDEEVE